jgi:chromosome segregation ATPase
VTRKRKNKIFQKPQIISLQEEINILEEEYLGAKEDLEDACIEYEAYDDEHVASTLTGELPLRDLHDLFSFESGKKIESNMELLTARKTIRQQVEKHTQDLNRLQFDLHQKKIDLLLAKTKILLDAL